MRPAEVAVWAVLIVGTLSLLVVAVVAVLSFLGNRRHQREMRAMQRATVEQSELAGSRSVGAEHVAQEIGKKVDDLIKRMEGTPPGGLPPTSSMGWVVACGLVLATVTLSGAGVRLTGDAEMPKREMTKAVAGDELARQGYRLMSMHTRDYKGAGKLLREARAAGGDPVLCLEGLVQCLGNEKRFGEAEAVLAELERAQGGYVRANMLRGWLLIQQGQAEASRPYLRMAAQNGDKDAAAMLAHTAG